MTSTQQRLADAVATITIAADLDIAALTWEANRQIRIGLGLPEPDPDTAIPGGDVLALRTLFGAITDPAGLAEAVAQVAAECSARLAATFAVAAALARGDSLAAVGLRVAALVEGDE